jgi:hypothetical protein
LAAVLVPSACATAQMHDDAQLNGVAQGCGLALGDVMQDASEKKLLFLMRSDPSAGERTCIYRWAHRNHLRLVVIHLANGPAS